MLAFLPIGLVYPPYHCKTHFRSKCSQRFDITVINLVYYAYWYWEYKKRRCGMIASETTVHKRPKWHGH